MIKSAPGWRFWLFWTVFSTIFIALSYTGIDIVERPVVTKLVSNPWAQEAFMVLGLGVLGGFIGTVQWLFLRNQVHHAGMWGLAMGVTYWVGASLAEIASFAGIALIPSFAMSFLLLGPVCGTLQWIILRTQVEQAGWWVVTQTVSWLVLFAVTTLIGYGAASILGGKVDDYLPASYALGGVVFGALTGAVLMWLLRKPISETRRERNIFPI